MANNEDKKLILLVDDEPANIQVAREILKNTLLPAKTTQDDILSARSHN